ncbi:aldo/keto reductase [Pelagibacteraceae bacterium]|nr:aldo/keto reductase [Pelagibacteraceae bacterium]
MISRRSFSKLIFFNFVSFFFPKFSFARNKIVNKKIIPKSGEKITPIGMGSWLTFDVMPTKTNIKNCVEILKIFFKNEGQIIDSSPMYGQAEKIIGLSLENITESNKKNLFSATKIWTPMNNMGMKQFKDSLDLWNINKFSLVQVHNLVNYDSHFELLKNLKKKGKIKYLGVTTSNGSRHEKLIEIMKNDELDFVQFTYNILDDEAEKYLLPLAKEKRLAVIINRPFQGGNLFKLSKNKKIPKWISDYGINTWSELYLKFIISHPDVTCVIPATSKTKHMNENMQSQFGRLLNQDERLKIKEYYKNLI